MAIDLSGLSAIAPGYQAAQDQAAKTAKTASETQVNQTKQRDAAIKLLGANVLGTALTAGNGPQAPPPGQASMPSAPPPAPNPSPGPPMAITPQGAPPVPQGGPPVPVPTPQPAAPVPPAPQAAGAPIKLGLQPMIAQILRTTPGVANHPEILLSALSHAKDLGLLDQDAEDKVTTATQAHTANRISLAQGHLKAVQDAAASPPTLPGPQAAAGPPPAPTATDPKTGNKVQWDGKAWQPIPTQQ